jgi:hypothetical protein
MSWHSSKFVKDSPADDPCEIPPVSGRGNMSRYSSAAERFRNIAGQVIEQLHNLTQAREAFQKAITASAKLRASLNAGDEILRLLMSNLERALNLSARKPMLDEKESEGLEGETSKPAEEGSSSRKKFL